LTTLDYFNQLLEHIFKIFTFNNNNNASKVWQRAVFRSLWTRTHRRATGAGKGPRTRTRLDVSRLCVWLRFQFNILSLVCIILILILILIFRFWPRLWLWLKLRRERITRYLRWTASYSSNLATAIKLNYLLYSLRCQIVWERLQIDI